MRYTSKPHFLDKMNGVYSRVMNLFGINFVRQIKILNEK